MDEHDASELLDGVESGLRAPGSVRDRAWREMQATLRGELPLQLPGADTAHGRADVEPTVGEVSGLVVALEDVATVRRRSRLPMMMGAVAAAVALIVGLVVVNRDDGARDRLLVDIPADATIDDPDLACARFLDEPIDTGVLRTGESELALIAAVEDAVARLRSDFEASGDPERRDELLGDGSLDDLARVEELLRQARLQAEQGAAGSARTTLALVPDAAERLLGSGGCLAALGAG